MFVLYLCHSYPSQTGGCAVFHGGCAVFWGQMGSFSGRIRSFLLRDCFDLEIMYFVAAGLLLPWKLCICVYWACAGNNNEEKSSDDPVFDSFD